MPRIVETMYRNVPTGVGAAGRDLRVGRRDLGQILERGAGWAIDHGYGGHDQLERIEEAGCLPDADPDLVSDRAFERGRPQLGTLGSGNHFAEVQYVAEIYDDRVAQAFGLWRDQITIMIHSGSRGLGHQVCQDHLKIMVNAVRKYGIDLPDRQLSCAPLDSTEGRRYLSAMAAAGNFAFANRQVMAHWVRESIATALDVPAAQTAIDTVYDVCHNIAKFETLQVGNDLRRVCVHRKGATRAYPPGHPQVPAAYRAVGQPVLVPGDMGRYSYVLVGTERAARETFGSSCHGAGRRMSRGAGEAASHATSWSRAMTYCELRRRACARPMGYGGRWPKSFRMSTRRWNDGVGTGRCTTAVRIQHAGADATDRWHQGLRREQPDG